MGDRYENDMGSWVCKLINTLLVSPMSPITIMICNKLLIFYFFTTLLPFLDHNFYIGAVQNWSHGRAKNTRIATAVKLPKWEFLCNLMILSVFFGEDFYCHWKKCQRPFIFVTRKNYPQSMGSKPFRSFIWIVWNLRK